MGRCGLGVGAGITGFSLSLPVSDTSVLLLFRCLLLMAHAGGVACARRAASGEDHLGALDGEAALLLDREDEPAHVDVDVVQLPALGAAEVGVAVGPGVHPEGPVAHLRETVLAHRLQIVPRLVYGPQ